MIAACDTFRAGAVEQLRTHVRHLNALHPPAGGSGPPSVLLYEKGYGKDAASIAMDAITFGELYWRDSLKLVLTELAAEVQKGLRALSLLCFSEGHSTVTLPFSAEAYSIAKIQYCVRKAACV